MTANAGGGVFVNIANGGLVELAVFYGIADGQGRDDHYGEEYSSKYSPGHRAGCLGLLRWVVIPRDLLRMGGTCVPIGVGAWWPMERVGCGAVVGFKGWLVWYCKSTRLLKPNEGWVRFGMN